MPCADPFPDTLADMNPSPCLHITRLQLLALWACVLYFGCVFGAYLPRVMWGTLGIFRPGDPDADRDVIAKDRIMPILDYYASGITTITLLLGIGCSMLLLVTVWITRTRHGHRSV
jgi:hypothetical protein